jgi:hypothetical protein
MTQRRYCFSGVDRAASISPEWNAWVDGTVHLGVKFEVGVVELGNPPFFQLQVVINMPACGMRADSQRRIHRTQLDQYRVRKLGPALLSNRKDTLLVRDYSRVGP